MLFILFPQIYKCFKKASKMYENVCIKDAYNLVCILFKTRKGKEVAPSFKHFFSTAVALSSINVSGTKIPPEGLK